MSNDYGTVFMGKAVQVEAEVACGLPHIKDKCVVEEEDKCPLCGGKLDFIEIWYKVGCALHKCETCGLAVFR